MIFKNALSENFSVALKQILIEIFFCLESRIPMLIKFTNNTYKEAF